MFSITRPNGLSRGFTSAVILSSVIVAACTSVGGDETGGDAAPTHDRTVDSILSESPESLDEVETQLRNSDVAPVQVRLRAAFDADVQDEIAQCMKLEGFEYIAWVQPALPTTYGVYTFPPDFSPVDQQLDLYGEGSSNEPEQVQNPNDVILDGLSEAEADAYLETMWKVGGCGETAYKTVEERIATILGPQDSDFEEAINSIEQSVAVHPQVVAAEDRFAGCLKAESGFEFSNENQIVVYFDEALGQALIASQEAADAVDASTSPTPSDDLDELIAGARDDERAIMQAYHQCIGPLSSVRSDVRESVTDDILKQYADQIEAILG